MLGTARQTMPFAVAFLTGDDGVAHRVAEYGLAADAAIPGVTDTDAAADSGGVVDRVVRTGRGEEVTGLREDFPGALLPGPLGPLTPDVAVVLPLTVSGRADPVGALVVGVNPYRPLDAEYRAFFTLIGRQFRVALTDAAAYEAEREKARLLADLDRAKMEFFQNVSHELRTPLTLLLAPLQDLLAPPTTGRRGSGRTCGRRCGPRSGCAAWSMRCWISPAPSTAAWTRTGSPPTWRR